MGGGPDFPGGSLHRTKAAGINAYTMTSLSISLYGRQEASQYVAAIGCLMITTPDDLGWQPMCNACEHAIRLREL